jgi:hypothetical protein
VNTQPTGIALAISTAAKAVLVAIVATGVLHWSDTQVTAITLAIAQLVELGVMFGLVKPRVTPVAEPKDTDGTPLVRATR